MEQRHLPVVRLTEQSLKRIKDKLEKLQAEKKPEETLPKKSVSRTPKFEVYKPGVTRLSNRSINFDKSGDNSVTSTTYSRNVEKSKDKSAARNDKNEKFVNKKLTTNETQKTSMQRNEKNQTKSANYSDREKAKKTWRRTDAVPKKSRNYSPRKRESSGESYDDEEEGFLARHERRRRREGFPSESSNDNSDHEDAKKRMGSDDEFIWDDYHGDFLKHWPHDSFSVSTVSDDVVHPELEMDRVNVQHTKENVEITTTNKEAFPATPSGKDSDVSVEDENLALGDSGTTDSKRGILIRISETVLNESTNDNRKQLFNPDNPDIPIMVRPNFRDKKIKTKSAAPKPSQTLQEIRPPPNPHIAMEENYNSNKQVGVPRYNQDTTIPAKYASRPDHWTAPVGLDYPNFDQDRNVEQDDMLSSGINDRSSEKSIEKLLHEAENLESVINNLLSNRQFNEKLQISRTQLKQIYKTLILHNIETATKHNAEQMLWKNVYYQLMEQLRKRIATTTGEEKNDLKDRLIVVLDQATEFYENLLMRLQQMYKINLEDLLANVVALKQFQKRLGKRTKLAMMTCHRSLICLGDVSRYKENANDTCNFGRARRYYMQARSIEPRNGRPYNQLALLAVQTRRKLDAIYYYARSLATLGNPILTARESLIALFDDARRKYQKSEGESMKQKEAKNSESTNDGSVKKRPAVKSPRMVWLLPGQDEAIQAPAPVNQEVPTADDKQNNESSMTPTQVMRHFILVFTHVHGKLFTRVGLDTFEKLKEELLHLFYKILSEDAILISKQTLLHIFAINFFTVLDQHQRRKSDPDDSQWLSIQAVQLAFSMMSILTRLVTTLLGQLPVIPDQIYDPTLSSQLHVLLPSMKVAYDWMYSNKTIWYPAPPSQPSDRLHDVWSSLAEMSDWLIGDFKQFPMRIFNQNHHNREEVCLAEDLEFAGFAPLANLECESRYVLISDYTSPEQKTRVHDCVRLDLIRDFLEYLCGMEDPLLAFKQGRYVVLLETKSTPEQVKPRLSSADEVIADMLEETSLSDDVIRDDDARNEDEDFSELRALRNTLKQTKYDHDKRKDQIMASLEATSDDMTQYVKPQNLIPDTNCFIDHLSYINALIKTGVFTVYLPLVVLAELQGLAQDSKGSDEHSVKVCNKAASALDFLQKKFSKERDLKLQALTNQGSILHTISFQSQSDSSSKATNDDLILQCCVKFEEKLHRTPNSATKTVLLSDDRNLRVKALARNMPTKALPDFCRWANVSKP